MCALTSSSSRTVIRAPLPPNTSESIFPEPALGFSSLGGCKKSNKPIETAVVEGRVVDCGLKPDTAVIVIIKEAIVIFMVDLSSCGQRMSSRAGKRSTTRQCGRMVRIKKIRHTTTWAVGERPPVSFRRPAFVR
eukprot:scaffold1918_cov154-Amphora_coffeaeformis.AAC.19